jgi:hypothetical protein
MTVADPRNMQALEDVASGETTMSMALNRAHSPREALEDQEKARRLYESAMKTDPDAQGLAKEDAISLMELAKLRSQLHIKGAANAADEAVEVLESLSSRQPENRRIDGVLLEAKSVSLQVSR